MDGIEDIRQNMAIIYWYTNTHEDVDRERKS